MPSDSDRLLIQQIRAGDPRAWETLIARYEGRLLAYVQRRLRDRSASEDVVQETFVGFLNSLPNFDERRELQTYLFTIASHKLTDHLRKAGRHPLKSMSEGNDDLLAPEGLTHVAAAIARHPDIGVVVRSYASFDDDPAHINQEFRYFDSERIFPAGADSIVTVFRRSVVISGVTLHRGLARERRVGLDVCYASFEPGAGKKVPRLLRPHPGRSVSGGGGEPRGEQRRASACAYRGSAAAPSAMAVIACVKLSFPPGTAAWVGLARL